MFTEGSSITGLQQQIKAAFGRWRKRGQHSSSQGFDDSRSDSDRRSVHSLSSSHRLHEDTFDSHTVRVSPHSRTFSHPHRLTVFPPFPSGGSPNIPNPPASKSSRSGNPFSFVRGLGRSRKNDSDKDQELGWSTSASSSFQEFTTFPLTAKSRSDHSLHRIIKDDNTWTVFATLRPPNSAGQYFISGVDSIYFGCLQFIFSYFQTRHSYL